MLKQQLSVGSLILILVSVTFGSLKIKNILIFKN
jgi:hypothetical protein